METIKKLIALHYGLSHCMPISEQLKIRLYERLGIKMN